MITFIRVCCHSLKQIQFKPYSDEISVNYWIENLGSVFSFNFEIIVNNMVFYLCPQSVPLAQERPDTLIKDMYACT